MVGYVERGHRGAKNENKGRNKEGSVCSFISLKLKVSTISVAKHLEMFE